MPPDPPALDPARDPHGLLTRDEAALAAFVRAELAAGGRRPLPVVAGFRPAAILVLLWRRAGEYRFVLTERTRAMPTHSGDVCFPGGGVQEGDGGPDADEAEAARAAALREAGEELGLRPAEVELLGLLDDYPSVSCFRVTPVLGLYRGLGAWRPAPAEVARVLEVPVAFFLAGNLRECPIQRGDYGYTLLEAFWDGARIWGLTAAVIYRFLARFFAPEPTASPVVQDEWLRAFLDWWPSVDDR